MKIDTIIKSVPSARFFSNEFLTSSTMVVTYVAIVLMVTVVSLGFYIQRQRNKKLLFRVDLLVVALSIVSIIVTYDRYTESELNQWKEYYLAPYVMSLPIEKLDPDTITNLEIKELYQNF